MRFMYLKLMNYIGIYNGMGLYDIEIDFSRSMHRVCVIKGTNGSGKSTIMNALSVFPDSNSSFIPNMGASKVVRLLYNNSLYEIKFFHDIKNNGTRDNTRAYISKLDAFGNLVELNPNGNVSDYKNIIYNEFRLDSNFSALSKLSMDDRGIGYKRPAERKKFVNSIIESLEVYNNIYKVVSKKVNGIKAIMTSITSKLGSIGDKDAIGSMISDINKDLDKLAADKNTIMTTIARLHANVDNLDPDGSIQSEFDKATKGLKEVASRLKQEIYSYHSDNMLFIPEVEAQLLGDQLSDIYAQIDSLNIALTELRGQYSAINNTISDYAKQLNDISIQIESIKTADYVSTQKLLEQAQDKLNSVIEKIQCTGIDPNEFTKDEYILALETVHEIIDYVNTFRSCFDYNTINECISAYRQNGYSSFPPIKDIRPIEARIKDYEDNKSKWSIDISDAEHDMKTVEILDNRPKECNNDDCYFISSALRVAAKGNPKTRYEKALQFYNDKTDQYTRDRAELNAANDYNSCLNMIHTIVRSIDKNGSILTRLPNGGIFSSKAEFFERLVGGDSFVFIEKMYAYIHLANYYEEYHKLERMISDYKQMLSSMESKNGNLSQIESTRDSIKNQLFKYKDQASSIRYQMDQLNNQITVLNSQANNIMTRKMPLSDQIIADLELERQLQSQIDKLKDMMGNIKSFIDEIDKQKIELAKLDTAINIKHNEREGYVLKQNQIITYEAELKEYEEQSKLYESLRYYSSPTTGIQLIFMQMYMGKILQVSNTLLSLLFGGQYQLQPFIINESEFRIPCLGEGYINDDISSMSSSQLTMISMILSFALLYTSSTEYNIIKLDEIDDPLDEPNRAAFAILLDQIMNIMNTEQCIMISHSSEIIIENADVILLRSDGISISPTTNIIWSFNQ